ncbi:MAG TPA: pentapeptide repeat-containing protein [Acidimicrobiia bacterium]|nr:pentapeptide repeat-containing protein [Acidimicrobiia bacterium]
MTLASDTPAIAALVTAFVAVVGLVVTAIFNQLNRRDAVREQEEIALHEASKRLASFSAPKRALGMAAVVEHLDHKGTAASARRIALNALHYETEPLVIELALDQIKHSGQELEATAELVHLNRHLWRSLFAGFGRVLAGAESDEEFMSAELDKLSANQAIVSRLVDGRTVRDVDFTDTFYPGLWAPEGGFVNCNFSSALLHYSNLRGARFEHCTFDRTILIGAYLEDATFSGSSTSDVVSIGARLHGRTEGPVSSTAEKVLARENASASSFLYEFEQDWRGHWTAGADDHTFDAEWWNHSDTIHAEIVARDHAFERRRSSDGNDGLYNIDRTETLDAQRRVVLIGGTRRLQSRVPSVWRAIWWQEPDPMKATTDLATDD